MTDPSRKDQPASPQVPPVIEGTVPKLTPPEVEATGKQIGGPPASTQVKPRKDQPEIPGYEFIKRLGKGGMGVVWLCKDVRADRLVALKQTISDELSESDRQRFRTEAQAMAKLQHANIVHVYEVNEHDGRPYFTMDYCPGGSLDEFLDRKPQLPKVSAEIVEKLALGVQHAHENGIIHRDLKPANVLIGGEPTRVSGGSPSESEKLPVLTQPGSPKLLKLTDFGLAKNTEASQQFTRTESVMGTPSYMSPEQGKETKSAGPSADVWSLGVILYECITGSLPFVGADLIEILDNIRHKDPVPPSEKVKCPKDLETICLKCLRKDPRDRYASAQALADDLRAFLQEKSISARPMGRLEKSAKWVRRNPSWAAMITLFVLTLVTGAAISLYFADQSNQNANKANQAASDEKDRAKDLANALKGVEAEQEKTQESLAQNRLLLAEATFNGSGNPERANELIDAVPERFRNWEHGYLKRKYQGGFATLHGHASPIRSISISPDGSRIVSGGGLENQGEIRVWEAKTGESLLELRGQKTCVNCVCFSPDSRTIASGGGSDIEGQSEIRVWNATTGTSLLNLKGVGSGGVQSVSFSPDGLRLASGSEAVRIWDLQTGNCILKLKQGDGGDVTSLAFSPDGSRLTWVCSFGSLCIHDFHTGETTFDVKGNAEGLDSVAFSPDGSRIVTGSEQRCVLLWDAKTGKSLLELKGHTSAITCVAFSSDGSRVASSSWDKTIRIWDAKTGQCQAVLKGHERSVNSVAFSPDGSRIVSGSFDQTVRIWNAKSGQSILELKEDRNDLHTLSFSPDNTQLATGGENSIRLWNVNTGQNVFEMKTQPVWSIDFNVDGSRIISGTGSHGTTRNHGKKAVVQIWNPRTGQNQLQFNEDARVVAVSPDGKQIAASLADTIRVYDLETGRKHLDLKGDSGLNELLYFNRTGSRIASGYYGGTVRIWDTKSGGRVTELMKLPDDYEIVSFSSDGSRIAFGSFQGTLGVWDTTSGQKIVEMKGQASSLTSLTFSPDGSRLASGTRDGKIAIWDAKIGQKILDLNGHISTVRSLSFSPDSTRIASTSEDKTIRIWDSRPLPKPGEPLSEDELTFRKAMSRTDPIWHRERFQEFFKANNPFAAGVQNYLLHKATAEEHFDYNRFDQAFSWSVAAQILKPKPPVIDWPELLANPKELK